jgi:hypothetical protein
MGRDGYYWSVDECTWVPSPQPIVVPAQVTSEPAVVEEAETA